jgi:hypothetical protein
MNAFDPLQGLGPCLDSNFYLSGLGFTRTEKRFRLLESFVYGARQCGETRGDGRQTLLPLVRGLPGGSTEALFFEDTPPL